MTQQFNKIKFLSTATLAGWAGLLCVDIISLILFGEANSGSTAIFIVLPYVLVGLPIAFISCFLIGLPILLVFEAIRQINLRVTILIGIGLGALFGTINIFILISLDLELWKIILDWLATVLIGGAAGYVGFKKANKAPQQNSLHLFD